MLAIILARGGSKEVPNKNIKMLGNKRLSHYALDALIKTSVNCRIVYSSDNVSYLSLAEAFLADNNAEQMERLVLHNRSAEMAGDHVSSWEAVAEILTMMNIDNFEPILLVSGVCPTLTPEDITLFVEKVENLDFYTCSYSGKPIKVSHEHTGFRFFRKSDLNSENKFEKVALKALEMKNDKT